MGMYPHGSIVLGWIESDKMKAARQVMRTVRRSMCPSGHVSYRAYCADCGGKVEEREVQEPGYSHPESFYGDDFAHTTGGAGSPEDAVVLGYAVGHWDRDTWGASELESLTVAREHLIPWAERFALNIDDAKLFTIAGAS